MKDWVNALRLHNWSLIILYAHTLKVSDSWPSVSRLRSVTAANWGQLFSRDSTTAFLWGGRPWPDQIMAFWPLIKIKQALLRRFWSWHSTSMAQASSGHSPKKIIEKSKQDWKVKSLTPLIQVNNNYEIVVNFFHISHNLTWYSAIVHTFTRIYPVCSTYELTEQFM